VRTLEITEVLLDLFEILLADAHDGASLWLDLQKARNIWRNDSLM
jgi:hypothetical protein